MPQLYHEPMKRDVSPETPESRAAAKAWNAEERQKVAAALGLVIRADGRAMLPPQGAPRLRVVPMPILAHRPLAARLDVGDVIDQAVEDYGLEPVIRCVRLIAAINGKDIA